MKLNIKLLEIITDIVLVLIGVFIISFPIYARLFKLRNPLDIDYFMIDKSILFILILVLIFYIIIVIVKVLSYFFNYNIYSDNSNNNFIKKLLYSIFVLSKIKLDSLLKENTIVYLKLQKFICDFFFLNHIYYFRYLILIFILYLSKLVFLYCLIYEVLFQKRIDIVFKLLPLLFVEPIIKLLIYFIKSYSEDCLRFFNTLIEVRKFSEDITLSENNSLYFTNQHIVSYKNNQNLYDHSKYINLINKIYLCKPDSRTLIMLDISYKIMFDKLIIKFNECTNYIKDIESLYEKHYIYLFFITNIILIFLLSYYLYNVLFY